MADRIESNDPSHPVKFAGQVVAPSSDLARLEKKIDYVILLLTGDGNPERGVIVRLDRIEQWRGNIKFLLVPVYAAVVGQVVLFVFGIVTGHIQVGFR